MKTTVTDSSMMTCITCATTFFLIHAGLFFLQKSTVFISSTFFNSTCRKSCL